MNRRELFASLLGLAALPLAKLIPVHSPTITEIINTTIRSHQHEIAANVARNSAIIELLERRIREATENFSNYMTAEYLYGTS